MLNDFRYAFRQLFKHPSSALVVIATLSLLVGAFTLWSGLYAHEQSASVPFPQPDRLFRLWRISKDRPDSIFPAQIYSELRTSLKSVDLIAALEPTTSYTLSGRGEPTFASGATVSASLFDLMGLLPRLGRTFSATDESAGEHVIILTQQLWKDRFNSDPAIIGSTANLDDVPYTVIGVMDGRAVANALFPGVDFWVTGNFASASSSMRIVNIVGRLRSDASISQLRAELDVVMPPLMRELPEQWQKSGMVAADARISAFPISEEFDRVDAQAVLIIAIILGLPVLIACSNLANILLGRIESRRREFAVRFSLGRGRSRVMRQVMAESVMLAMLSVPGGVLLAIWAAHFTARDGVVAEFNPTVLASVLLLATILGLLIGCLPAWCATRADLATELKEGGGSASGGVERHRLRRFLASAQMAMATVLCIIAGLLVRSFVNRLQFSPGFDTSALSQVAVLPRTDAYRAPEKRLLYCTQIMERLAAVPGVSDVAVGSASLVDKSTVFRLGFRLTGGAPNIPGHSTDIEIISPNLMDLAQMRLLRGRALSTTDRRGATPVMVVNQSFADQFFPGVDPIGKQCGMFVEQSSEQWITVIGVTADRRSLGFRENSGPEIYLCHLQFAPTWMEYRFFVRAPVGAAQLTPALRQAARSVDPSQPVVYARTVESEMLNASRRNLGAMAMIWAIAAFGLIMAILGVYGVVSRSVVERTHEVGVRMALGARQRDVLILIVRQGMQPAMLGLLFGIALAAAASQPLKLLLFGVGGLDAPTYTAVCAVLVATSLLANALPGLRATKVNPIVALRCE